MAKKTIRMLKLQETRHPAVFEVNARVLLRELSEHAGKRITLGTVPDEVLDQWAALGFDAVWLMGVWTTGTEGREIARSHSTMREEYARCLKDLTEEDIAGSPYAVRAFVVAPELGGERGLAMMRRKLAERGLALLLDFVANHTARDCAWVHDHPDYYITGASSEALAHPDVYFRARTVLGDVAVAFGRDPLFPGWTDTAQLNIRDPRARRALIDTLITVAGKCDGVRCDMGMLLLNEIFDRTWGDRTRPAGREPAQGEFWWEAINAVRAEYPSFVFIAEAYWNKEWDLQQLGFTFTYDKVLYDRLLREGASSAREHLKADLEYQWRSLRFIENHDEPRIAQVLRSDAWHFAAAIVVSTIPGCVLVHDGQLDGRIVKVPVQLTRRPQETVSEEIRAFYQRLLGCVVHPVIRQGQWKLVSVRPAWHDNRTWQNFLIFWWHHAEGGNRCVVVNYAPHSGQCYAEIPLEMIDAPALEFRDLLGNAVFVRDRAGLASRGMYFDLPAYGFHLFDVTPSRK